MWRKELSPEWFLRTYRRRIMNTFTFGFLPLLPRNGSFSGVNLWSFPSAGSVRGSESRFENSLLLRSLEPLRCGLPALGESSSLAESGLGLTSASLPPASVARAPWNWLCWLTWVVVVVLPIPPPIPPPIRVYSRVFYSRTNDYDWLWLT